MNHGGGETYAKTMIMGSKTTDLITVWNEKLDQEIKSNFGGFMDRRKATRS